jgi:hypothetical protein
VEQDLRDVVAGRQLDQCAQMLESRVHAALRDETEQM